MRCLRRTLSLLLVVGILSNAACAATWQEFQKNPIVAIQNKIGVLNTALNLAKTAFEIWAALNPDNASQTRMQFLHVVAKVDQGIKVAQDGLKIASTLQQGSPNLNTLFGDAQAAMTDVNAFLSGLASGTHGTIDPVFLLALQATDDAAHGR